MFPFYTPGVFRGYIMGNMGKKWVNISTQHCKPHKCYECSVEEGPLETHLIFFEIMESWVKTVFLPVKIL